MILVPDTSALNPLNFSGEKMEKFVYRRHEMGKANDIETVWSGKDYEDFRQDIFSDRKAIKMCTNCSEGTKTYVLPGELVVPDGVLPLLVRPVRVGPPDVAGPSAVWSSSNV